MGYFWKQLLFEATLWDGIRKFGKVMRLKFIKFCGSNASYYFFLWSFCLLFSYNQNSRFIIRNTLNILPTKYKTHFFHTRPLNSSWPAGLQKTVHRNMPRQLCNAVNTIAVQPVKSDISTLVNFWPWRKSFMTKCGDYVLPAGLRLECSITVRTANARRFNWKRWPLFTTGFLFCTKLNPSRSDISRHGNARQCLNTLPWVL